MNIAIVGSGNIGGTLARGWAQAGHRIFLGVRDQSLEKVRTLCAVSPEITAHSVRDAVRQGDVIVIAAHPEGTKDIVDHMGDVEGKIIIDCMNSVPVISPIIKIASSAVLVSLSRMLSLAGPMFAISLVLIFLLAHMIYGI